MTDSEFAAKAAALVADIKAGNPAHFETRKGFCWRFAHAFHSVAADKDILPLGAVSAKVAYKQLTAYEVSGPMRAGDFLFWTDGQFGHVAVVVSGGALPRIIENTSSSRGKKLLGAIRTGTAIRSGYHIVRPPWIVPAYVGNPRVVVRPGPAQVVLDAKLIDGTLYAPVRALGEALGYEVHAEHLADQGKVYVKEAAI